jgi:hypothetical protein
MHARLCMPALVLALLGLAANNARSEDWGTIKGQIVWGEKDLPPAPEINVDKDKEHCLAHGPLHSEEWVINPKNKGVRYTFVWLAPATPGSKDKLPVHPALAAAKLPTVTIDQPTCMFEPHAVAIQQEQELIVKNSAPIAHNVNWSGNPLRNPGGNVLLAPKSSYTIPGLKADRLPLKISCNIHPWMNGWLGVFNHPYFAVTDADGNFEIKQAPAGKYRLVIWHGSVGFREGAAGRNGMEITIKDSGTDLGKLELKSKY